MQPRRGAGEHPEQERETPGTSGETKAGEESDYCIAKAGLRPDCARGECGSYLCSSVSTVKGRDSEAEGPRTRNGNSPNEYVKQDRKERKMIGC